jgi:hypothetical protein
VNTVPIRPVCCKTTPLRHGELLAGVVTALQPASTCSIRATRAASAAWFGSVAPAVAQTVAPKAMVTKKKTPTLTCAVSPAHEEAQTVAVHRLRDTRLVWASMRECPSGEYAISDQLARHCRPEVSDT